MCLAVKYIMLHGAKHVHSRASPRPSALSSFITTSSSALKFYTRKQQPLLFIKQHLHWNYNQFWVEEDTDTPVILVWLQRHSYVRQLFQQAVARPTSCFNRNRFMGHLNTSTGYLVSGTSVADPVEGPWGPGTPLASEDFFKIMQFSGNFFWKKTLFE